MPRNTAAWATLVAVCCSLASAAVARAQIAAPFGAFGEVAGWFDRQTADSASLGGVETPVFAEAFRQPMLDARRWELGAGNTWLAEAGDGGMRLSATDDRPLAELRTRVLDLSAYAMARVRVRTLRSDSTTATLDIDYIARTGFWTKAAVIEPAVHAEAIEFALPADALHAATQLRLRTAAAGPSGQAWVIREVAIFGRNVGPERVLSIGAEPDLPVPVTLRVGSDAQSADAATPLRLSLAERAEAVVAAPPVFEGLVLSHWLIDNATRIERRRGVAIDGSVRQSVVAEYRPAREDDLAYLAIRSEPEADIAIVLSSVGIAAGEMIVTNRIAPCLRGEKLTLLAPKRTPRLVFDHWRLSGGRAVASPVLEVAVNVTQSLTAVYAVLGDMNADGVLDAYDVDLFCEALKHPGEAPLTRAGFERCDMNGDGLVDEADIEAFVERLVSP